MSYDDTHAYIISTNSNWRYSILPQILPQTPLPALANYIYQRQGRLTSNLIGGWVARAGQRDSPREVFLLGRIERYATRATTAQGGKI